MLIENECIMIADLKKTFEKVDLYKKILSILYECCAALSVTKWQIRLQKSSLTSLSNLKLWKQDPSVQLPTSLRQSKTSMMLRFCLLATCRVGNSDIELFSSLN